MATTGWKEVDVQQYLGVARIMKLKCIEDRGDTMYYGKRLGGQAVLKAERLMGNPRYYVSKSVGTDILDEAPKKKSFIVETFSTKKGNKPAEKKKAQPVAKTITKPASKKVVNPVIKKAAKQPLSKRAQAQKIYNKMKGKKQRKDIIAAFQEQIDVGAAYASTLYQQLKSGE